MTVATSGMQPDPIWSHSAGKCIRGWSTSIFGGDHSRTVHGRWGTNLRGVGRGLTRQAVLR